MNQDDNTPPEDDKQPVTGGDRPADSSLDENPSYDPELMSLDKEPATSAVDSDSTSQDQPEVDETADSASPVQKDAQTQVETQPDLPVVDSSFSDDSNLKDSARPGFAPPASAKASKTDATAPTGSKKPKKKLLVGGIVAVGLALLIGGGVAAYTLWYQNPDRVVHQAMLNLISASDVRTETVITSDSELAPGFVNIKVKNIKLVGAGSSETVTGDGELSVTLELNGRDYTVGAKGRFTEDKTVYFQLNDVKDLVTKAASDFGGAEMITPEAERALEAMQNRWVKVTLQDMLTDSEVETAVCIIDTTKRLANDREHADQFKQIYKDNQFLVVGDSMGSKDGNLGYKVEIDQEALKDYVKASNSSPIYDEYKKCPGYEETGLNDTDQSLDDIDELQASEDVKFDVVVWVSRFGHELRQVDYTITGKGTADNEVVFNGETKLSYDAVKVEAPEESVDLETWQNEIEELTEQASQAMVGPQAQPEPITYSQYET